jgi:integral membrane protein
MAASSGPAPRNATPRTAKNAWDSTPQVGEYLTDNDPKTRLVRKIRITKWMAILETVSYCALLIPMYRKHILNDTGNMNYSVLRIIAYFHGIIAAAFAVMAFDIRKAMKWSWAFFVVTLVGPIGALIAHQRLRRQPVPQQVTNDDMFF